MTARKSKEKQIALSFIEKEDGDTRIVCVKTKSEEDAFKALIANNIKAARRYANMTQEELAEKLYGKNSKNRVCEFESGKVTPNHLQLSKISKYTGVSLDYIYGNSPEPLSDNFGVRHGLAMSIIQEALKPATQQLAALTAKAVGKIPTSGTIVLVKKTKDLKRFLNNVRNYTNFEKDIAGSANLIKAAEECINLAEQIERDVSIDFCRLERAAVDAIIHDEKLESGHMLMADMFDPVRHVVAGG